MLGLGNIVPGTFTPVLAKHPNRIGVTGRIVGYPEVKVEWPCVRTIRTSLGHESLDVTLAYLKGKDAESEEAQEHANSSSLALYA
jgi:hypothetical protein